MYRNQIWDFEAEIIIDLISCWSRTGVGIWTECWFKVLYYSVRQYIVFLASNSLHTLEVKNSNAHVIVLCAKNLTQLWFWPFYDHLWSFFHKLHFYPSQNWGSDGHFEVLNKSESWLDQKLWHKSQFFWQLCPLILKEKTWRFKFQKWPFFDHLWSFFDNYIDIFHKTEIQTVILRCFVCKIIVGSKATTHY